MIRKKILKIINNSIIQSFIYSPFVDFIGYSILNFVKREAKNIKKEESIIDVGAGELRYKNYFSHCKYVSQDLCVGNNDWDFNEIDIKSSIYNIPVEDKSFNYVLCTQVLEHLDNPDLAFKEFYRILKDDGKIFLTAPLGQSEHQTPYDFFRFTKYGLEILGKRNNFELVYIKPSGGIFINMESIIWESINMILPFKKISIIRYFYYILFFPFKLLSGIIFLFFDLFDFNKNYTNNYLCIFKKIDSMI
jgi:SAM-dependent methyltransferase